MLKGKYKFYLAFENSICKDYVTEKFYVNALQHNMLPVVINAGNFSDSTVAPSGCCIKALDFKSAKELAGYIRMVASNSTLYSNYFKWHSRYTIQEEARSNAFCRACHRLYILILKRRCIITSTVGLGAKRIVSLIQHCNLMLISYTKGLLTPAHCYTPTGMSSSL